MEANYFTILYWFCHTSTWSPTGIHVFLILNPPPSSLPVSSLWVIPVHQPQASSIMHRTWTGNLFHVWYYTCFNAVLPNPCTLALSHRLQKTVLYRFLLLQTSKTLITFWLLLSSVTVFSCWPCWSGLKPPSWVVTAHTTLQSLLCAEIHGMEGKNTELLRLGGWILEPNSVLTLVYSSWESSLNLLFFSFCFYSF